MEGIANRCRKGVKRKHEEEDNEQHALQRKSIIDMSMGKLRTSHCRRGEPCLRRSVLILNTLKHIESELAQEGVHSHQSSEAAMNEIPEMSLAQLTLDPLPDMSSFMYPLPASPLPMSVQPSQAEDSESSDYLPLVDSAIVDLMPCKPMGTCQDGALSHTSSSVYSSGPLHPPASSGLSVSSLFYSSTVLESTATCPLTASSYQSASIDDVPSLPLCSPSSLSPGQLLQVPRLYGAGDSPHPLLQLPKLYEACDSPNPLLEVPKLYEAGDSPHPLLEGPKLYEAADAPHPLEDPKLYEAGDSNNNSATLGPYANYSAGSTSSFGEDILSEAEVIEFLHSLQETSDTAAPATSSPASSSASVFTAQCSTYCRSDSALDELDSIMQVLVGI